MCQPPSLLLPGGHFSCSTSLTSFARSKIAGHAHSHTSGEEYVYMADSAHSTGSCKLWRPITKGAAAKAPAHLQIQFQTCPSRWSRRHKHPWMQESFAHKNVGRKLKDLVLVMVCPWRGHMQWNRLRSHTLPVEEHDESLAPKRQRETTRDARLAKSGITRMHSGLSWRDGRSYRHLVRCQQKCRELGLSASSSSRDALGDTVMSDVPTQKEEAPLHLLNHHLS